MCIAWSVPDGSEAEQTQIDFGLCAEVEKLDTLGMTQVLHKRIRGYSHTHTHTLHTCEKGTHTHTYRYLRMRTDSRVLDSVHTCMCTRPIMRIPSRPPPPFFICTHRLASARVRPPAVCVD